MTAALDDRLGALLGDTELALRTWLPEQPWAGHRVDRVRLRVLGRFTDQLAWGGPAGLLTVAEARTGGEVVRYGLPLGLRAPRTPLPGVVPITSTGELAGYDAAADDLLTAELTALIGTGAARDRVRFVPRQRAGLALVPRRGLTGRVTGTERGATSVVLGERYLLKLFRRLPAGYRMEVVRKTLGPEGSWWIRDRFEKSFDAPHVLTGTQITKAGPEGGALRLELSCGRELEADHVIAATGFEVDVRKLTVLGDDLRGRVRGLRGGSYGPPALGAGFGSSVRGLHMVGLAAAATFGPSMRFVCGAAFAARAAAARLPR